MWKGRSGISEPPPKPIPSFPAPGLGLCREMALALGVGTVRNPKLQERRENVSPSEQSGCAELGWSRVGQPWVQAGSPRGQRVTLTRGDIAQG